MKRWTNEEDRIVVDFRADDLSIEDVMRRLPHRSRQAIYMRRSVLRKRPCPFWVTDKSGEIFFCENGNGGHWGTCSGERELSTYIIMGGTWP